MADQDVAGTPAPLRGGASPGLRIVHRRYVPYSHAHYAGNLVDGAYAMALFGDVATDLMIHTEVTRDCSPRTPTSSSTTPCAAVTSWR